MQIIVSRPIAQSLLPLNAEFRGCTLNRTLSTDTEGLSLPLEIDPAKASLCAGTRLIALLCLRGTWCDIRSVCTFLCACLTSWIASKELIAIYEC